MAKLAKRGKNGKAVKLRKFQALGTSGQRPVPVVGIKFEVCTILDVKGDLWKLAEIGRMPGHSLKHQVYYFFHFFFPPFFFTFGRPWYDFIYFALPPPLFSLFTPTLPSVQPMQAGVANDK